jgi:CubicO group peptidase (beta-lactamase class C family)
MSNHPSATNHVMSRRNAFKSAAAGAALAAMPAGIAGAQHATPAATPEVETSPGVTPDRVATAIAELPSLVQGVMEKTGVPGVAVGVVFDDEVRYL